MAAIAFTKRCYSSVPLTNLLRRTTTTTTGSRAFSSTSILSSLSSSSSSEVNLTPDKTHYVQSRKPAPYKLGKHRSNALELLQKQPIIEVEGDMAVCDGGGGALGHPLEYIKLGHRADYASPEDEQKGVACIYCGLRYRKKAGGHH